MDESRFVIHRASVSEAETQVLQEQKEIDEILGELEHFLHPPFIYTLPPNRLQIEDATKDPDYYNYMCRAGKITAVAGWMSMAVQQIPSLMPEEKAAIKQRENALVNFETVALRTEEEMTFLRSSIVETVAILNQAKERLKVQLGAAYGDTAGNEKSTRPASPD